MIILPPEEKKPSPVAKWIFRILLTLCIFIGMGLFGLSILSGTSDAHRHGLEQAMSNIFRTNVRIVELKSFNLFPQFLVDVQDVQGISSTGTGAFFAKRITVAFSLLDILRKKGLIEDFQIEDLHFEAGLIGPKELILTSVKIVPAISGASPFVDIKGTYGGTALTASVGLDQLPGRMRPAYRFVPGVPVKLNLGEFSLTGVLGANKDDYQEIKDVSLKLNDEEVMSGAILLKPVDGKFALHISFKLEGSSGLFVYVPSGHHQTLTFDKANLDDFTKDKPLWLKLMQAWHRAITNSDSAKIGNKAGQDQVSLKINELQGAFAGNTIKGEFIYGDEHITGWWSGNLDGIHAKNEKIPASGAVECALVRFAPKGESWISDYVITVLPPFSVKSLLEINEQAGTIKFKTEQVTKGVSVFGEDLSAYSLHREELGLAENNVCADIPGFAPVPAQAPIKSEPASTPATP